MSFKTIIPDDITLRKLRAFVMHAGFKSEGAWGPYLERFSFGSGQNSFDLVLPATDDIDDYDRRKRDAISVLIESLDLSKEEVIEGLRYVGFKKFDIKARPGSKISTISYQEGSSVLYHGAELVRHAAIRAYSKDFKPQNRGRRPAKVDQYMERLEIGQTSVGSYVFSLLLPDDDKSIGWGGQSEKTRDQSVSSILQKGIGFAETLRSPRRPRKNEIENVGLAAEFYDHLYEIIDWADNVALSIGDPASRNAHRTGQVQLNRALLPSLRRTIDVIAPPPKPQEEKLVGTITKLSEPSLRRPGSLQLKVRRDGRTRSVRVPFAFKDRELVIEALKLKSQRFLEATGYVVVEENGHLKMEPVKAFRIVKRGPLF